MNVADALVVLGKRGLLVLIGFVIALTLWGILEAFGVHSEFTKFIAEAVTALWSMLLLLAKTEPVGSKDGSQ